MSSLFRLHVFRNVALALVAAGALATPVLAAEPKEATVDLGEEVPDADSVEDGLFPEDACKSLRAIHYKCMGSSFTRPSRFSLSFNVGSAVVPEGLRRQLEPFVEVFKQKRGTGRVVRIEGHADASGTDKINQELSERRAAAVKAYFVDEKVDPAMLETVGRGSKVPKAGTDPYDGVNRRVEIFR